MNTIYLPSNEIIITKGLNLTKHRVVDLFAGTGGLSHGFERAGYEIVAALDFNEAMAKTYLENHPHVPFLCEDIRSVKASDLLTRAKLPKSEIELVVGGPPCQGFSTVGDRDPDDPRNSLFDDFMRILREVQPRGVLIENVTGILSMEQGKVKRSVLEQLRALGYRVDVKILNALDFGVPQRRKRVFFVGLKSSEPEFPSPSGERVTVRDAISDLPSLDPGEGKSVAKYEGEPTSEYSTEMREASKKLYNHVATNHTDVVVERIHNIPPGGNHQDLPERLKLSGGFPNMYGRLEWNEPADTITGNCGCVSAPGRFIHPRDSRGITVREAARLQSFPDEYRFYGTRREKYRQVGNAVPPLLAEQLARSLKPLIR